jgi:uncharacterized protein (TIGR02099 family)
VALGVVLLVLLLALWVIVHALVMPRAQDWKPWVEQRITSALGQRVTIGHLQLDSRGGAPVMTLTDVRLQDSQGRTALIIGQLRAVPSLASLWSWQPRLQQLYLEGLQLDVRRDPRGHLHVAGLDTGAETEVEDDGRGLEWLLSQHEIVLRGSSLRWTDEQRAAPSLELRGVDLLLRNGLLRHQWRLDASPPADWGDRFTVIGQFSRPWLQQRRHWQHWSGTAYAVLPRVEASRLGTHVSLPFELTQGRASLRAWLDVQRGQWRALTADVQVAALQTRLAPALQPVGLAELGARWVVERTPEALVVAARGLTARTDDGLVWPVGDWTLRWEQREAADGAVMPVTGGELTAQQADLAVVSALATRLPLGAPLQAALRSLAPEGLVSGLSLRWRGPPDAPTRYEAQGKVRRLALAARPAEAPGRLGRPGLSGADIDIALSSDGGRAQLAMRQGALVFPGVFEDPTVPVAELDAALEWQVRPRPGAPPAIELTVTQARLANDDVSATLRAAWQTGARPGSGPGGYLPGLIDLQGEIVSGRADRVAAYLPLSLPGEVRRWVSRAVRGGQIEQGSFAVKGDIWQIPFAKPGDTGTFRIAGRLRDAQFDYLPSVPAGGTEVAWTSPWPGFTQVSGELLFDRATLRLDQMQARLWGVQLRDVRARIDDLERPLLRVQGEGRGPVADLLRFVDVSPVGQWLGGGLKPLAASGQGDLLLDLSVPLQQPDRSTVRGSVLLPGNDVQVRADMPLLAGARGRVDFSEQGFQIVGATARVLGGEASFEGGSQPDGSLRFQAQGIATAEGLRQEAAFAPLPVVARHLRGQAAWRAQLAVQNGRPELSVTSDLVGLASDWPAPLAKPEVVAWPLRWQTIPLPAGARDPAVRDQLRLDIGTLLQLRAQREWPGEREPLRVVAAGLGVNEPAPAAEAGGPVEVRARLASLDVDAWQRLLKGLPSGNPVAPGAAGGAGSTGSGWPTLPRIVLRLETDELRVAGRQLSRVRLAAQESRPADGTRWQADLQAQEMAGRVQWREPRSVNDSGALVVRLERASLPLPEPTLSITPARAAPPDHGVPPRWPAVDLAVEALELRGRPLGRVAVVAAPQATPVGAVQRWRIERLDMRLPGALLKASGQWAPGAGSGAAGRVALDVDLELQDSARLAASWGWADAVRGGSGRLSGRVGWPGEPWAMELATLEGQLTLALDQGQFLRAEPGIGRVLGILSLQSLPRRLLLDFRDVFQQGFAFDEVRGDIALSRGKASTDNLRMRGVQASVLISGHADLVHETQDLRVLILPDVNAGAASLAYAAINPAIGLGTFLAQLLLRDPLRAAGSREFHVSGSMTEPKVERIERAERPAAVPPGASAPAGGGGEPASPPAPGPAPAGASGQTTREPP